MICVGHSAWDRVSEIDAFPSQPTKVPARAYRESGGGMAANAAAAVARLGGHAAFWGPVGDDALANAMRDELTARGVDTQGMHRVEGAQSSTSSIIVDVRGERLIVNYRGSALDCDAAWLPLGMLSGAGALLADVRWPVGAGRALHAARTCAVPTVLDGDRAERATLEALVPASDYVIFSESGLRVWSPAERADALRAAVETSGGVAAVTVGANGSWWLIEGALLHYPAPPIDAVDTTGAGDVFHGAFALAIAEGQPLDDAIRFATAAAALKCAGRGPRSVPPRDTVERMAAGLGSGR